MDFSLSAGIFGSSAALRASAQVKNGEVGAIPPLYSWLVHYIHFNRGEFGMGVLENLAKQPSLALLLQMRCTLDDQENWIPR